MGYRPSWVPAAAACLSGGDKTSGSSRLRKKGLLGSQLEGALPNKGEDLVTEAGGSCHIHPIRRHGK